MADKYVYSGAVGAADGTTWADAYVTLTAGLAGIGAGDTLWVAHDHAESTAGAVTLTGPGTVASPCRVLCVNRAGTVPPVAADLATTATCSTTGASNLTLAGYYYVEGIIFSAGDGANTAVLTITSSFARLKNCALRLGGNAGTLRITGASTARSILNNVTVQFAAVGQSIQNGGICTWRNTATAISGATIPTVLFTGSPSGKLRLEGVDLSAVGSGKTLFGNVTNMCDVELINCKLEDDATKRSAQTSTGHDVKLVRSSETGNYKFERFNYLGDETTEITVIRTGGSSDGTQGYSKKIVTTANAKPHNPFEALPIEIWNDVEDVSRTVTVYGIWGGGAVPDDDEIWIDVDYMAHATSPQFSTVSSGMATVLSTPASVDASSETWGGGTTDFQMSVDFTPAQKGPVQIRVRAGVASSTFYICAKPTIANT
jgi:hypothetical protein